jgi:soluble lytic murein transglycosylase-like protein
MAKAPNQTNTKTNLQNVVELPLATVPVKIAELPTPVVKTQSVAPTEASGDVPTDIVKWANIYGTDPDQLLRVARCESHYRPDASNGSHFGIFQFAPSTFYANEKYMGLTGLDYWNADNNIQVAAWMFAHGQQGQWSCK